MRGEQIWVFLGEATSSGLCQNGERPKLRGTGEPKRCKTEQKPPPAQSLIKPCQRGWHFAAFRGALRLAGFATTLCC